MTAKVAVIFRKIVMFSKIRISVPSRAAVSRPRCRFAEIAMIFFKKAANAGRPPAPRAGASRARPFDQSLAIARRTRALKRSRSAAVATFTW